MTKKEKQQHGVFMGILLLFGIPGIFWMYFDWKAAVASCITIQIFLVILKFLVSDDDEEL